jgi:hypothetical protein
MSHSCSAASLERDEPALGSASTVRAFLLVENSGPWGVDALRDARLPEEVTAGLRAHAARSGVRVLLVRRHRGVGSVGGLRVFAAWADAASPWLESATLGRAEELLDLDVDALGAGRSPGLTRTRRPVFCVCTHGRHDSCCALLGRPTATALTSSHPEETWDVSHIGGDRFAANVLVLPEGLYYGRVSAAAAPALAETHLAGHLDLDLLRGRSGLGFPVQVAEVAVRRVVGETRTHAVRLLGTTRDQDDVTARLDVAGTTYDVVVRRSRTEQEHLLTCRARRAETAPTYDVLSVTRR